MFVELIFSAKVLKVMQFLPNGLKFSEGSRGWLHKKVLISAEERRCTNISERYERARGLKSSAICPTHAANHLSEVIQQYLLLLTYWTY